MANASSEGAKCRVEARPNRILKDRAEFSDQGGGSLFTVCAPADRAP